MRTTQARKLSEVFRGHPSLGGLVATCPHCATCSMFKSITSAGHSFRIPAPENRGSGHDVQVGVCQACHGIVFGVDFQSASASVGQLLWPLETWPDRAPADLEEDIRKPYDEARAILPLSPQGAAVLARRCLQHLIRKKLRIKKDRLFDEISEAEKREDLSKPTRGALHHVREIGNWGAHPSVDQAHTVIEVEPGEAEYTLETVEMVFQDLYVAPARIDAMTKRLENRKQGAQRREKGTDGSREAERADT